MKERTTEPGALMTTEYPDTGDAHETAVLGVLAVLDSPHLATEAAKIAVLRQATAKIVKE